MITVEDIKALIKERDEELSGWYDTTLTKVMNGSPAKLFDGGMLSRESKIESWYADWDGSRVFPDNDPYGASSYAEGASAILKHTPKTGEPTYFRVSGYYDSWDNGNDDVWIFDEFVRVKPHVPTTVEWVEC